MQKIFQAIRSGDIDTVRELIQNKHELISCVCKQPPKKDDGQSPLQVALKSGNLEIAEYLVSEGADVNFIESEECCNKWRAPVIHDAINAAIMCSRWNVNSRIYGGIKVFSTKEKADKSYGLLKEILMRGADVNALDSYGNSCIWRACLQARQILPTYNYKDHTISDDHILTPELKYDLGSVFDLLYANGMDGSYIAPSMSMTAKEFYKDEPVAQFLR